MNATSHMHIESHTIKLALFIIAICTLLQANIWKTFIKTRANLDVPVFKPSQIIKMNASSGLALAALFAISCTVTQVCGLSFMLPPNVKKCLQEEIHKDVLVTGEYKLSGAPGHKTLLHVSDSKGHILYTKDDALEGKFAFTSDDYDTFEICFSTKLPAGMRGADREVYLNVKRGVEAKSYEDIAKSEALKPMEVELRRLEDLSEAIVNDFAYMKAREEEMRDTNESTNSRVLYFSIFSMVCLLSLATWQVFYLRRYFKSKKLIE